MSDLSRRAIKNEFNIAIDPTTELLQPGGPFPAGHAILTDGFGCFTIAQPLRTYMLSFTLGSSISQGGYIWCDYHGISSESAGVVIGRSIRLTTITCSLNTVDSGSYVVEVLSDHKNNDTPVATLEIGAFKRLYYSRNYNVLLIEGSELSIRIRQTVGQRPSTFSDGIVTIELEV